MPSRAWPATSTSVHRVFLHYPSGVRMSLFEFSDRTKKYQTDLLEFMDSHIYPAEAIYDQQMLESGNPHYQPPIIEELKVCLLYTSPSPRDRTRSRMPSSA